MNPNITITRRQPTLVARMTLGNTLIRGMTKHPMVELLIVVAPILAFLALILSQVR